jgi:flagellar biosynthetic protein FliR
MFELIAAAVLLALDGHHLFFTMMDGLFQHYPVGASGMEFSLERLIRGVSAGEEWGLMLAAPVALCLFAVTVVLSILGRAASQINLHSVGFSMRLGVGLVALLFLLPQAVAALVSIVQQSVQTPSGVLSGG